AAATRRMPREVEPRWAPGISLPRALVLGHRPGEPGIDLGLFGQPPRLHAIVTRQRLLRALELLLRCGELCRRVVTCKRCRLLDRGSGRGELGCRRWDAGASSERQCDGQDERSEERRVGKEGRSGGGRSREIELAAEA